MWHRPSKTPVPYSRTMHSLMPALPLPGKNPGRQLQGMEDGAARLAGGAPFQACSESAGAGPIGPLQRFLREDSGLGGHRRPGPKASWLQSKQLAGSSFFPGPLKHHFQPLLGLLLPRCRPKPALPVQSFLPPAQPLFHSLSLHIYFFSLLLLLPCLSSPCHPSPAPEWVSLPFPLSDRISPRLSFHPCTSFFVFLSPSPGPPASLLPRLASASPSLPIFCSVSSP